MPAAHEPHSAPPLDWAALVPVVIHPLKVQIVEAMQWIGRPLSPTELAHMLGGRSRLSVIAYHVKVLKRWGVLQQAHARRVRGSTERFYSLSTR